VVVLVDQAAFAAFRVTHEATAVAAVAAGPMEEGDRTPLLGGGGGGSSSTSKARLGYRKGLVGSVAKVARDVYLCITVLHTAGRWVEI
jgi:hypothetical protein